LKEITQTEASYILLVTGHYLGS